MGVAIGRALDSCLYADECRLIVGLVSRGRNLRSLFLVLQLIVSASAICSADEPPTVAELRQAHSTLRGYSSNVQGEIRVYRSETATPAALEKGPSEIEIPLILRAHLWRNESRFRADDEMLRPNGIAGESRHASAVDGGKVYELSSGLNPDGGTLRVLSMDSPEGAAAMEFIANRFYKPIDALWSMDGVAFTDLLQNPLTEIVPNKTLLPGYALLLSSNDNGKTSMRLEFDSARGFSFGYGLLFFEGSGVHLKKERRVFSTEKEGVLYPSRVVDVVSMGPDTGYTEIVTLDLEPLQADSPIAKRIAPDSFRNTGIGYQVYDFTQSGKDPVAERYNAPKPLSSPGNASKLRTYVLWVNGFVVLALIAFLVHRRVRKKKGR